ncbi:SDR family oxidoreductase [Kineococcus gypseus]|uniref:NAD-dependent epimerase/dehydratase family protein n=1 Tax=Kineococcus gypseus TaxID=1637102 RepID=UPI003D7CCA38
MRVFTTGASGWIGTATTARLLAAGHQVTGLARSATSARTIEALGAEVVRGDMSEHDLIVEQAQRADAVVHLAFTLDFTRFEQTVENEVTLIAKVGSALHGSGKAFVAASGTPILPARLATEDDVLDPAGPAGARARTAEAVLALSQRGIRSALVRMPRSVHGAGDRNGLIATLVDLDRRLGTAAYVGDGHHRWPAVHLDDAAHLLVLALERAPAASVLHAVGEQGVPMREVAEVIAEKTGLAPAAVDPEQLGVFGALLGTDQPASSALTRRLTGWQPTGPSLLEDLAAGYYTD